MVALTRATDEVAQGHYDVELPRTRKRDEIGRLTDSFRDMTRRLAEADARERNFLMSVSHELRTPLTAIRGHVAMLEEGVVDDPEASQASLDVIRSETDRLARLVGDLLDLARLDAHRFTLAEDEVELRRLLEGAFQSRAEEARRRGIDYEQLFRADPILHTDGDRVLQIVTNLIDNAFYWTPDGGRIALGLESANGTVAVSVSDSGPGIAEADRERIFRPFFSGENWAGRAWGSRSRGSSPRRSAVSCGSTLSPEPALGSSFGCRRARRVWRYSPRRRGATGGAGRDAASARIQWIRVRLRRGPAPSSAARRLRRYFAKLS